MGCLCFIEEEIFFFKDISDTGRREGRIVNVGKDPFLVLKAFAQLLCLPPAHKTSLMLEDSS